MLKFFFYRLSRGFLVILGVIFVVFFLFHALPGDPVSMMAGQRSDVATRESIIEELGLDEPLPIQLLHYLRDLSPIAVVEDSPKSQEKYSYFKLFGVGGEKALVLKRPYMRRSFQSNRRVDDILMENIEATLILALAAMAFATIFGVFLGVLAALHQNSFWDNFLITGSVMGISVPSFVSAIVVSMIFGYYLSDYTHLNLTGQLWQEDPFGGRVLTLKNLILPAFTLGIRPLAVVMQLTRSSMIDVMRQDYIRTARAKGLSYFRVVTKHALKNALNPVLTAVSGWLASLMTGAFFIELVFDWKGFGFVTLQAVQSLDFPVVIGATLFIAVIFVVTNIIVDLLYAALDPRVRLN